MPASRSPQEKVAWAEQPAAGAFTQAVGFPVSLQYWPKKTGLVTRIRTSEVASVQPVCPEAVQAGRIWSVALPRVPSLPRLMVSEKETRWKSLPSG